MVRKVTPAQYKQMIDKYNREVRSHNQKVKQQINAYNQQVKKHNAEQKRKIDNYNREVRKVNALREKNRQQLNQAIRKFNSSRTTTTIYYRESVQRLESTYTNLESRTLDNQNYSEHQEDLLRNYPAQEANNSVQLYNSLNGVDDGEYINPEDLQKTYIEDKLNEISTDMGSRWRGALFSLNPQNPDAGRHFCTSVREVYTQILDVKAPDEMVKIAFPDCELHQGKPNRRSKIKYILTQKSLYSDSFEDFVDSDIDELLSIFRTLNDGTHGSAGRFTIQQLSKLKIRVEDSIQFIAEL
ncbi:MAG: hypothetical protein JXR61_01530 [Prolixibacteraceae bacterium]|nr:hypothetical protein [Prolixibacteraceae bacterium]